MKNEKVRLDFLGGLNGAIQLTEADLKVFDDLWIEVSPNHFSRNGSSCLNVGIFPIFYRKIQNVY